MTYKLKVGESVYHHRYPGIVGVIEAVYSRGLASVRFGDKSDYFELINLEPADKEIRDRNIRHERERLEQLRRRDERQAVAELERVDGQKRKIEELERQRREEIEKLAEGRRQAFLKNINLRFQFDFLSADAYFQASSNGEIAPDEYTKEKLSFVKLWLAANMPQSKNGENRLPSHEQLAAIAAVNGHVQVVARAGSGKTTTLVNRTLFLLKHCGVAPSQMLLLAFNRKAVLEIRRRLLGFLNDGAEAAVVEETFRRRREAAQKNRIVRDDIEISAVDEIAKKLNVVLPHVITFHALAHSIVHPEGTILFDGLDETGQGLSKVFQQVIDDHLHLPEYNARIRELMLAHFREDWDRIIDGGYNQSKDELLKFRRSVPRESLGGEYVKSYGEKVIADFLFEHDIAYKYERNHWWSGINYRPDFTLFKVAKKGSESGVIIEYFGLKGEADYDKMSADKREYWAGKKSWSLIDFCPNDITNDGVEEFLCRLKSSLERLGIRCSRLSEHEIWHRVRDRAIDRFTKSVVGFIGRCRKLSWSPLELQVYIGSHVAQSQVETMFLGLAHRLYAAYLDRLSATGEDDFDGLMQRAADNINAGQTLFLRKSGGGDLKALRYVCIDEYQDFSDLFFRLLTAIRKQNPNVELFCVGDDWQAINGFAGSDLRFFKDFSKYIGESRKLYIPTNYRSSRAIVDVGNTLMHGLGQPAVAYKKSIGKVLLSDLNLFEPTLLERQSHPGDCLTPVVLRVVNQALADGLDVVLLCRRNGLPYFVNYGESSYVDGRGINRFLNHIRSFFPKELREKVTISTAHKYKGLEKSVVILLDAVGRSYPLIHPDWVFSRVFDDSPAKITNEERRLLYVALTRAIDTLVIFTEGRSKSPFLEEIDRKLPLNSLNWVNFPSVSALTDRRFVVQIKNQVSKMDQSGTYAVKDQLHANRYNWHAVKKVWEKSFPENGFSFEIVRNEIWAASAGGVDVTVLDDAEAEMASYKVDFGVWKCKFDNLGAKEGVPDCQTEFVK